MSECFLGEIRMFAGTYAPKNWSFCNGSLLSISENQALFTLVGTTYGGDGQSTFALPDLRGRTPIGQGAGPTLTPRTLGQFDGTETVSLSLTNMPVHTHPLQVSQNAATSITPTGLVPAVPPTAATHNFSMYTVPTPSPAPTKVNLAPTMQTTGNNVPHENMMPGLCVNFIIALLGIYPSQS